MSLYGNITLPGRPDLDNIRRLDLLVIPATRSMMRYGFAIDREHLHEVTAQLDTELDRLRIEICSYIPCFILEDRIRPGGIKIKGETAIPQGTYEVVVTFSNRFKRRMPLLLDVPNFSGIRIHSGNTAEDTEGCLLTGKTQGVDFVGSSRDAYGSLFAKIEEACDREKVYITIRGVEPVESEPAVQGD